MTSLTADLRSDISVPRRSVVASLALRHLRVSLRTGRLLAALALVAAISLAQGEPTTPGHAAMLALVVASIVSLIVGAGRIARDFGSGMMMLDRLHGATAAEIAISALAYAFTIGFLVLAVVLAGFLALDSQLAVPSALGAFFAAALVLLGWSALIVLLGTLAPGEGNAAVAFGLVIVVSLAPRIEQSGLPAVAKMFFRLLRTLLPIPTQFVPIARAIDSAVVPYRPLIIVALMTVAALVGAVLILNARDPASGWRR